MNRDDWIFVGIRIIGVWYLVSGLASVFLAFAFFPFLLHLALGFVLATRTRGICAWLSRRDNPPTMSS